LSAPVAGALWMPESDSPEDGSDPRGRLEALDRAVKSAMERRAAEQSQADARENQARQVRSSGAAWRTVSSLVLATGLLSAGGFAFDAVVHTSPFGVLVGMVIGFAVGMWIAARAAINVQAKTDEDAAGQPPAAGTEGRDGDLR